MLRTSELEYDLPERLIATRPASPRDSARLLVVDRETPEVREHHAVRDLPALLREGDLLVVNDTRVLPARLEGMRRTTGGRVGGLFLAETAPGMWRVMLKSNGRLREGDAIDLRRPTGEDAGVSLALVERLDEGWRVEASSADGERSATALLARAGATPLPPYILAARKERGEIPAEDDFQAYQTVYAGERAASVAAPTAGLHFTPELLARLDTAGVRRVAVTLHVGAGTFKPVETQTLEEHPMHAEWCEVSSATLDAVRTARTSGGRVICVGTTSARALESVPTDWERARPGESWVGETRLLISPGHEWRRVDGLMTNFHLPRSTLLAMVSALLPGGVSALLSVYEEAIGLGYRFYSYGDAMLVLPGRAARGSAG